MNARLVVLLTLLFLLPVTAQAQSKSEDLLASQLSAQEKDELYTTAYPMRKAIFRLEGSRKNGTGFVISRRHRLLATNAHVVQGNDRMTAIQVDTQQRHQTRRYWTHPDYKTGNPSSADIAIVQLGSGPPLSTEFKLTPPEHGDLVQGRALINISVSTSHYHVGTPSSQWWWGTETGIASNVVQAHVPGNKKWVIESNIPAWGGHSGSPIFLANGHVVGVSSGSKYYLNSAKIISVHVLVDPLWELLSDLGYEIEAGTPCLHAIEIPERTTPQMPSDEAREALAKARLLIDQNEPDQAHPILSNLTNNLAPRWAEPHAALSRMFWIQHDRSHETGRTSFESCAQYANSRFESSRRALRRDPTNLLHHITLGYGLCSIAHTYDNKHISRNVLNFCEGLENKSFKEDVKARIFGLRACALKHLGRQADALHAINRAISLTPSDPDLYYTRSNIYAQLGRHNEARRDKDRSRQLR